MFEDRDEFGTGMKIIEAIERRMSVRAYERQPIPEMELRELTKFADSVPALTPARMIFHLDISGGVIGGGMSGVIGDYGKLITAPHYLAILSEESEGCLIDAGYRFERVVLESTRRGFGTCWIGGFFNEPKLLQRLGVPDGLRAVALTPLGYPARGMIKGALQRMTRQAIGATKRKLVNDVFHWIEYGRPLPPAATVGDYGTMIEAIRRAPSWANKQPWRFIAGPDGILLFKTDQQVKEGKDYHLVDCGIVMSHLELAAGELGHPGAWDLQPRRKPSLPVNSELIARFAFDTPFDLPV